MTDYTTRQSSWALWSSNRHSPATTDDIPYSTGSIASDILPRLIRHTTDPISTDSHIAPVAVPSLPSIMSTDGTMAGDATITFSQGGVQPPVYVVTSLSGWITLEMNVDKDKTETGDLIFRKQFSNVGEGRYQYKIRIGESHWVVDESKESEMDQHGNRNNVIHVKPASQVEPTTSATHTTTAGDSAQTSAQKEDPYNLADDWKDSSVNLDHLPEVPVPFVTVNKVADKEQPAYGDVEPVALSTDASKRTADAEPDFEEIKTDPPEETSQHKSPEVPLLIVERTDDKPAYGDDFGENATITQKIAHEMRAADATPDKLVVSPDPHTELGSEEEQAAPLLRHESTQADEPPPPRPLETLDDESTQSSTDHTSTGDAINTPSEPNNEENENELSHGPYPAHETGLGAKNGAINGAPTFPETEFNEDDTGEIDQAPLLSHETGLVNGNGTASDDYDDEDEIDKAPLLSHETGFSDHKEGEVRANSDYLEDDENQEPQHYGRCDDEEEDDSIEGGDNNAPLLPHERDSAVVSNAGSDDGQFSLHEQPTFGYETDSAKEFFGGSRRPNMFRARTNSSTLPHKLPRSDAEDENLHDPSLERFPTDREQILERVAAIGLNLPEDESMEDHRHSPPLSVLSQACSSVDLAPVKSYTSLALVPEAEAEFSDVEEEDEDVDSLPSPVYIGGSSDRASNPLSGLARDSNATPLPRDSKQLASTADDQAEAREKEPKVQSNHTTESSEAGSVNKHDGAKDASSMLSSLGEAIATPAKMLNPMTPPLTPEHNITVKEDHSVSTLDAELRERRKQVEGTVRSSEDTPVAATDDSGTKDKVDSAVKPALAQQSSRFLAACVGDRKRASASVMVLGAAAAAYYYLA